MQNFVECCVVYVEDYMKIVHVATTNIKDFDGGVFHRISRVAADEAIDALEEGKVVLVHRNVGEVIEFSDILITDGENELQMVKDGTRIAFLMYSNGSNYEKVIDIFEPVKRKFEIQISYDGQPIHDLRRKDIAGAPTSARAREAIRELKKAGFTTLIKSTLKTEDSKYLPEVWDDFNSLREEIEDIRYSPTIEHKKDFDPNDLVDFENSLKKLVLKEKDFYRENERFLWSWIDATKSQCTLFRVGLFVDVDGGLYYCHGCPYEDECGNLWFGEIGDPELLNMMKNNYMMFKPRTVNECKNCVATMCLNCNVVKYINSNMDEFIDRWYDYTCVPTLCEYYKLFGKYNEVLRRLLRR